MQKTQQKRDYDQEEDFDTGIVRVQIETTQEGSTSQAKQIGSHSRQLHEFQFT
jgi:hypothetical protein